MYMGFLNESVVHGWCMFFHELCVWLVMNPSLVEKKVDDGLRRPKGILRWGISGSDRLTRDKWSEEAASSLLNAYEAKWLLRNRTKLKGPYLEDAAATGSSLQDHDSVQEQNQHLLLCCRGHHHNQHLLILSEKGGKKRLWKKKKKAKGRGEEMRRITMNFHLGVHFCHF